jgi:hypothetical protein
MLGRWRVFKVQMQHFAPKLEARNLQAALPGATLGPIVRGSTVPI